ncbi:hypothetical protein E3O21_06630 [Cryobacterium flavum]|uniref:MmcQ/YjbR family DNA-binding protein n=1 Tax=Cryobacterium flavum TaxID=1424659 RepID=A0ABY2I652_9MICO|nr:MmcQ/YjbR family DNA-binding protein [Cryobacterium flavum]TFB78110.1 hypothetical protein E3O21_06630 [Cryobacterium flavum]
MVTEDDVRRVALSLPETIEKPSYGTPGFRVNDVLFARIHEEPNVLVVWRESVGDRDALITESPAKFFTTPHYVGHTSVLVRLHKIDESELIELLTEAWDVRAPARLRTEHHSG